MSAQKVICNCCGFLKAAIFKKKIVKKTIPMFSKYKY